MPYRNNPSPSLLLTKQHSLLGLELTCQNFDLYGTIFRKHIVQNQQVCQPALWNLETEKNIAALYETPASRNTAVSSLYRPRAYSKSYHTAASSSSSTSKLLMTQSCLARHWVIPRLVREITTLQVKLKQCAHEAIVVHHLDYTWTQVYSPAKRQSVVLEGLCHASLNPEMEGHRRWCPELTVANLAGQDSPSSFVHLLKKMSGLPTGLAKSQFLFHRGGEGERSVDFTGSTSVAGWQLGNRIRAS